jgi:hypothetical protein
LREAGPTITALEDYPFDKLTERYCVRAEVPANWKLFMDALPGAVPSLIVHRSQRPGELRRAFGRLRGAA